MATESTPVSWLLDAFDEALNRLHAAIGAQGADAESTFAPLLESLTWVGSIEMQYREAGREIGDEVLSGLSFVRGRVHHQWAQAIVRRDFVMPHRVVTAGGVQTFGPPVLTYWTWARLEDLPAPSNSAHANPRGQSHYRQHVAERDVVETLTVLRPTLDALRP